MESDKKSALKKLRTPSHRFSGRTSRRSSYTRVNKDTNPLSQASNLSHLKKIETFLQDALNYRDTTYQHSPDSIYFYRTRHSPVWRFFSYAAAWLLLVGSFFPEVEWYSDFLWLWVFTADFYFKFQYRNWSSIIHSPKGQLFVILFCMMGIDLLTRSWTQQPWSAVLRPAALVYIDVACYNTFVQTILIFPSVLPMLAMELFLILIFTCLCVVLYGFYDDTKMDFSNAPKVFVQLFQLQTTVNDPDVWLPLYAKNPWNAVLFISFLVTNLFFMHNIVLAVVYEAFAERKKVRTKQRAANRRRALKLAFDLLDPQHSGQVKKSSLLKVLSHLRPHYPPEKIEVLYLQIDPENQESISFDEFQKITLAMNMRVHALRGNGLQIGPVWKSVELFFALGNVLFVLFSCGNEPMRFFFSVPFWIVSIILSLYFCFSVAVDFKRAGFRPYFRSSWKIINLVAVICSFMALIVFVTGNVYEGEVFWEYDPQDPWNRFCLIFIMFSRCLDMTRVLSRIDYFRNVMKTVMDSLPSIYALFLVIYSFFHIFCYIGMVIWGGRITAEVYFDGSPPFYYLNNFNSYREGMVTLFELLVVNNWNIISSGYFNLEDGNFFVYFFFIFFNIFVVTVLMNLFTSFFISAFLLQQKDSKIKDTSSLEGFGLRVSNKFWLSGSSLSSLASSDSESQKRFRLGSLPYIFRAPEEDTCSLDQVERASFDGNVMLSSQLSASLRSSGHSDSFRQRKNPNYFCSARVLSDDDLFGRMTKMEEVSSTAIVQALSTILNEGIRVNKGAEIIFENENFSKVVSSYGKKVKILRYFGPAIQEFEPKESDTFPFVLSTKLWNHPEDLKRQLRIVCCIAQIDPQIIMYVSKEVIR